MSVCIFDIRLYRIRGQLLNFTFGSPTLKKPNNLLLAFSLKPTGCLAAPAVFGGPQIPGCHPSNINICTISAVTGCYVLQRIDHLGLVAGLEQKVQIYLAVKDSMVKALTSKLILVSLVFVSAPSMGFSYVSQLLHQSSPGNRDASGFASDS